MTSVSDEAFLNALLRIADTLDGIVEALKQIERSGSAFGWGQEP